MMERFKENPYTGKPMYYKDNPEAMTRRNKNRMWVNGKYISKSHPLHKPGRYKSLDDAWSHSQIESTTQGEVYVIVNKAWPDWVKVGKAVSSEDRLNGYQTSSPFRDYEVIATLQVDNRHDKEREMHKTFAHFSKERRGEWFNIDRLKAISIFNVYAVNKFNEEVMNEQKSAG